MKKKMVIALAVIAAAILLGAVALGAFAAGQKTEDAAVNPEIAVQTNETQESAAEPEAAVQQEEEVFEIYELYGTVTEITDEYVMLETKEHGMVQVNLTDDTAMEGAEAVHAGQVIKVLYDGMMTRSLPAQINAMLIGVYAVYGEVTEAGEGSVTVRRADTGEDVIITLPQDTQEIAAGDVITAYTTGVSTMSIPPQMNAVAIVK